MKMTTEPAHASASFASMPTGYRAAVLLLAVFCFASRAVHIEREKNFGAGVGAESEAIARSMLAGRGFSLKLAWGPREFVTAHMPPALPYLLEAFYYFAGDQAHRWFCYLQALAQAVSLVATVEIARHAFGMKAGLLAGVFFLFDLNLSFTATWVQETAFNIMFTTLGLWTWISAKSPRDYRSAIFAGICFGLGSLFRPVILLIAGIGFLWSLRNWDHLASRMSRVVLATAVIALVIAPWTLRNYRLTGRFIPICQNWAINFWLGYNEDAGGSQWTKAGTLNLPVGELAKKLESAHSEEELDDLLSADAKAFVQAHPMQAVALRPRCWLYFWLDHNYFLNPPPYAVSWRIKLANLALVLLSWIAIIRFARTGGIPQLLVTILLVISLFYTCFHADIGNRFRLQVEPLMLILLAGLFSFPSANSDAGE